MTARTCLRAASGLLGCAAFLLMTATSASAAVTATVTGSTLRLVDTPGASSLISMQLVNGGADYAIFGATVAGPGCSMPPGSSEIDCPASGLTDLQGLFSDGDDRLQAVSIALPRLSLDFGDGSDRLETLGVPLSGTVDFGAGDDVLGFAGSPATGSFGDLTVRGGDGDDVIGLAVVVGGSAGRIELDGGAGNDRLSQNETGTGGSTLTGGDGDDSLSAILVGGPGVADGGPGNDSVTLFGPSEPVPSGTATGGDGDDTIVEGPGRQTIDAGAGVDTIQTVFTAQGGATTNEDGVSDSVTCGPGLDVVQRPNLIDVYAADCPPVVSREPAGQIDLTNGRNVMTLAVSTSQPSSADIAVVLPTKPSTVYGRAGGVALAAGRTVLTLPLTPGVIGGLLLAKFENLDVQGSFVGPGGDVARLGGAVGFTVLGGKIQSSAYPIIAGVRVGARVISGKVYVRLAGKSRHLLTAKEQTLPLGTEIDTRHGRIEITAAAATGKSKARMVGQFYDGVFVVTQLLKPKVTTVMRLSQSLGACKRQAGRGARAAVVAKSRRLWGDGKGRFRTKGKHAAATVRGTRWLVRDTCSTTLTKVARGTVEVRDLTKAKTVIVRAGRSYTARRRR